MCGIFAYIGKQKQDAFKICIEGLKKLEYRGYDSAGFAGLSQVSKGKEKIHLIKSLGKVAQLEEKAGQDLDHLDLGIAHTRWATHGKPSQANAHPHCDDLEDFALVHNGIIENHDALRTRLKAQGKTFYSQTDSEVIVKLIASFYQGDLLQALRQAMPLLEGAFAIALIHKKHSKEIIAAAKQSPLAIGLGEDECFLASDSNAFLVHTRKVVHLVDGEIAVLCADDFKVYDERAEEIIKKIERLVHKTEDISKGNFEHFMLKEIFEQVQTVKNALLSRFVKEFGTASFDELEMSTHDLLNIKRVLILACGTSWHAGLIASYMMEEHARIPVQVEYSSEFRYKNPIVEEGTLLIAISQSGETADTIAAVREAKAKGAKVLAICNIQGSTLAREADSTLFLRAGLEVGVASTKAFTSQLIVLSLLSLLISRARYMSQAEGLKFLNALEQVPSQIQRVLDREEQIEQLAKKYAHYTQFFFLGRHYMYPCALEGALKLKEISYVNANAYPAGEMKHGPIALIDESCPTVAFCTNRLTMEKMHSNLMEIKARSGPLIAIHYEEQLSSLQGVCDDFLSIPNCTDEIAAILSSVVAQLFAYYIAKEKGAHIDQPRNLAKSVTVE